MKKLIVLFILPLTLLIAIEFKMTKQGLFPVTSTMGENTTTNNLQTPKPITANHAPAASNISIKGTASTGNKLTLDYTFSDIDGNTEGNSIIAWSTPTKELQRSTSKTFIIPMGYEGTQIGAWIHPKDTRGSISSKAYSASNNYLTIEMGMGDGAVEKPTEQTEQTGPITDPSMYLEKIILPRCDATNSEVQFIKSKSDWSHINDSNKRIFCVSSGDYTSLANIKITTSGTAEKKRYIILNNGNNIHPGKLNKEQLANYGLEFYNADYWVIDRAASFDIGFTHSFILNRGSSHNTFNRMFTQNIFHTMWIKDNANYNTIQNSRFDGITRSGAEADLATINHMDGKNLFVVKGTKAINNEFINVKAFRLNRFSGEAGVTQVANFEGIIFDHNTIEFTDKIRTDCKGNYNTNGNCVGMESGGIGIKSGSNKPEKPIIVTNNILWGGGYRSDPTLKYLSNKGGFSVAYMGAKNIFFQNNVIFDTMFGIIIADRYDAQRGTWNVVIKNNIFLRLTGRSSVFPLSISQAEGADVQHNLIKDSIGAWARVSWNYSNNTFANNIAINPGAPMLSEGNQETIIGLASNKVFMSSDEAGYTKDYIFIADKYTNKPRTIRLSNTIRP